MLKSNFLTTLVLWALKTTKIVGTDRTRIINALLADINALPIKEAISFTQDGKVLIRGKSITIEQAQAIQQGAQALSTNSTHKLIHEQVLHEANLIGLHKGLTPEDILFAKACIWVVLQEEIHINQLL